MEKTSPDAKLVRRGKERGGNRSTSHSALVNQILLYFGGMPAFRLWKNHVGVAAIKGRVIRYGLPGSSDIMGITAPGGRFIAIEVKTGTRRLSPQQKKFRDMVSSFGGIYVEARCLEDVKRVLLE